MDVQDAAFRVPQTNSVPLDVWAVVVTRNRRSVVLATLAGIVEQTQRPKGVVLVDNGSADGTLEAVAEGFPEVLRVDGRGNNGYAGGLNLGLGRIPSATDAVWILDDDSPPMPYALEVLSDAFLTFPRAGIIGSSGFSMKWGVPRSVEARASSLCDATLIDNSLVRNAVFAEVGQFRADFFMMWEDMEFCARLRRHGFEVRVVDGELAERGHLGSLPSADGRNDWRGYYQARNQLRDAIDQRSATAVAGALYRHMRLVCAVALRLKSSRRRVRCGVRLLGLADAFRGRTGKVDLPPWVGPHP